MKLSWSWRRKGPNFLFIKYHHMITKYRHTITKYHHIMTKYHHIMQHLIIRQLSRSIHIVVFYSFYDRDVHMQIWFLLTINQCRVSDTQMIVKARGLLVRKMCVFTSSWWIYRWFYTEWDDSGVYQINFGNVAIQT